MYVNLYERIWMWGTGGIIVLFLATVVFATVTQGRVPPSHIETIDPQSVFNDPRFAQRGVTMLPDGSVEVIGIAMMFAFLPAEIRVPAGKPVTFRLTSPDVMHGFQIVGTNANTMIIPGYVSQFTIIFDTPGEYLFVCIEYCGLGHHGMFGKLIVERRD